MHRFVLPEFNTHRDFSRNSASSRAIPLDKQLQAVIDDPAFPFEWPCEKAGMQGGQPLAGAALEDAEDLYKGCYEAVVRAVEDYLEEHPEKDERLHKSVVNRLLEPFMWHTVIVSATRWENFFKQRASPLAQPEIRVPAEEMIAAYEASTPVELGEGEWHTPYINDDEAMLLPLETRKRVSVGRCARVSYLTHDGVRDPLKDVALFTRLISEDPPHASPLEHVATPFLSGHCPGNFDGWQQLRHVFA